MKDGYAICFNEWALDKEIKNELGLLLIISSLCAEKGYCYASNEYLAKVFDVTEISISAKLKKLKDIGYITIEYEKRGCEIISREIRLKKFLTDDYKKFKSTIKENFKDNNISNNNINNNKKEIYKERFIKPTLEEVKEYCLERKNNVDAERFINFYESKGWYVGKNKMKDWKACVRTWEAKDKQDDKKEETPVWFNEKVIDNETSSEEWDNILNTFS